MKGRRQHYRHTHSRGVDAGDGYGFDLMTLPELLFYQGQAIDPERRADAELIAALNAAIQQRRDEEESRIQAALERHGG